MLLSNMHKCTNYNISSPHITNLFIGRNNCGLYNVCCSWVMASTKRRISNCWSANILIAKPGIPIIDIKSIRAMVTYIRGLITWPSFHYILTIVSFTSFYHKCFQCIIPCWCLSHAPCLPLQYAYNINIAYIL